MTSLTIENYVKTIYSNSVGNGSRPASTGQIASSLGVSPGTVTSMLKTLSETGLATYTPYEGVKLTSAGRALALRVLRRHRLIELFLVQTLGLSWDEVHDEAENMEHAVSDFLVDRFEEFLGHPNVDPHGDPIPSADGNVILPEGQFLSEIPSGTEFEVVRVLEQAPEFLRNLASAGLRPGSAAKVVSSDPATGSITVVAGNQETILQSGISEHVLVQPS